MAEATKPSSDHLDLVTLLDRGEAFRAAVEELAEDGNIAWIGEPDHADDLVLRTVHGDLTGQLRGLHVPLGLGLTGKVHRAAAPAWVDDYFGSPVITHTFDRQIRSERVRRLLAVPIVHGEQVFGVLAVGARCDGTFGDRAAEHANEVAGQAALALAVAERARHAREAAVLEERSRVAADLHDTVGALLFAIGSGVAGLAETSTGNPDVAAQLQRLQTQVAEATNALRTSLRTLRASPSALALSVAMQGDCSAFSDRTGLPAELIILDDPPELAPSRADVLISAVREALLNVEKHARASAVVVTVSRRPSGEIIVAVTDDGVGLGTGHAPGLGLSKSQEAVARVGGALRVTSDPHGGTTFRVEIPC
ncbi:GAF domain-containing sensor histidine kinase [Amycolatopsis pithecellobii]|uniref:GAF domain-containing sensor histidine kinase n=1 Tax=Amycolatopsis pithecellobii TaxID=664692 RepID=UPI0028A95906|nr:GAF domain-containing protein [Amycolatopsis pithecellobii]